MRYLPVHRCPVCPTRYRTRHFFNNSNTNEDIVTKLEQEYARCVRNEEEWITPSFREYWCLVWDVSSAHNWSHLFRCNRQNSCIYGNLQHLCKSIGRWGTLNWIFPAGWRDIPHFTSAWPKFNPLSATASFRRDFGHRARPIWRSLIVSYGDIWKGEFTETNHEP